MEARQNLENLFWKSVLNYLREMPFFQDYGLKMGSAYLYGFVL